ncbi:MAG: SLBB domain-containing protein [Thermoleptolyngbya sp. C42_A2020_037]|nr:SLBB domain-containing protein [Thermoleptolyngbya sp. C42_A2020_037]
MLKRYIASAVVPILSLLPVTSSVLPAYAQAQFMGTTPIGEAVFAEDAYTLGPGDRIQINLFRVETYSGPQQVLVDGTLNLPLAGTVFVEGLTLQQAAAAISQRYAPFYRRPIVTVSLLAPRPLRFSVSGEVARPGSYVVSLASGGGGADLSAVRLPTLTSAIRDAGGVNSAANVRQIQIRRTRRTGPNQSTSQLITVNLWNLLQRGDLQQDITLRDGDSILIPAARTLNLAEARQLASANLYASANRPIDVVVVGEVKRPGSHTLASSSSNSDANERQDFVPTVTRAIQAAGGITEVANVRQIQVRRQTASGTVQTLDVDLWALLQEGDVNQDTVLQNGDTVLIPTATDLNPAEVTELATATFSPDSIPVYVVGEVNNPGLVQLRPNTPLNQAILAAGGFNNRRARRSSVKLLRLNPDGTVTEQTIPIDFSASLSAANNPALRGNDVIVVGRSDLTTFSDSFESLVAPLGSVFPIVNLLRLFGL